MTVNVKGLNIKNHQIWISLFVKQDPVWTEVMGYIIHLDMSADRICSKPYFLQSVVISVSDNKNDIFILAFNSSLHEISQPT